MYEQKGFFGIGGRKVRIIEWWLLINLTMLLSIMVLTGFGLEGLVTGLVCMVIVNLATVIRMFPLKKAALKDLEARVIAPQLPMSSEDARVYHLVSKIVQQSGLEYMPEIGIYESSELDACTTGSSRKNTVIILSTGIINAMDDEALSAVIAHEVGHIVSDDMLIQILMSKTISALVWFLVLPWYAMAGMLKIMGAIGCSSSETVWVDSDGQVYKSTDASGWFTGAIIFLFGIIVWICTLVFQKFFMFLGNLLSLYFSRHREFRADAISAKLTTPPAMIRALGILQQSEDVQDTPISQKAYAELMISTPPPRWAIFDIFFTHPGLDRRIQRLKEWNVISKPEVLDQVPLYAADRTPPEVPPYAADRTPSKAPPHTRGGGLFGAESILPTSPEPMLSSPSSRPSMHKVNLLRRM